ncbi:hypothetical protein CBOM_02461 [Ceraceosorus bombacis]|uniref:Uncharacterized protein n=1 Tax=Ceraceosorus bombacis TaxID=401625 RepID=A0A0P1BFE1_9BASI|nr:hypothetical protein CBOM_02461 [Ceraceosorus bombacis]
MRWRVYAPLPIAMDVPAAEEVPCRWKDLFYSVHESTILVCDDGNGAAIAESNAQLAQCPFVVCLLL